MKILYVVPLILVLGGCSALGDAIGDTLGDPDRLVSLAGAAADAAVVGIEEAGKEDQDWVQYGVGTILSLILAWGAGKGAHSLYRSGRTA